ncbi:hypothetical protein B0H13DRAFT_1927934 [Mycena leptocephala]|nr:hypothetical protein B0H13DRAFT_1927934 [Mycena leptocephala]
MSAQFNTKYNTDYYSIMRVCLVKLKDSKELCANKGGDNSLYIWRSFRVLLATAGYKQYNNLVEREGALAVLSFSYAKTNPLIHPFTGSLQLAKVVCERANWHGRSSPVDHFIVSRHSAGRLNISICIRQPRDHVPQSFAKINVEIDDFAVPVRALHDTGVKTKTVRTIVFLLRTGASDRVLLSSTHLASPMHRELALLKIFAAYMLTTSFWLYDVSTPSGTCDRHLPILDRRVAPPPPSDAANYFCPEESMPVDVKKGGAPLKGQGDWMDMNKLDGWAGASRAPPRRWRDWADIDPPVVVHVEEVSAASCSTNGGAVVVCELARGRDGWDDYCGGGGMAAWVIHPCTLKLRIM